jgi:F0F1-type ATP synthase assembly protein I
MPSGLKKALAGLLILSAVLFLTGIILFKAHFPYWYFRFFPFLVLIFLLVNAGFLIAFYQSVKQPDNQFIRGFMRSKVIKLMIYLLLVIVYVLTTPKTAVPFAVTLSVLYIAYTAYDLYIMTGLVKRKKENPTLPNQVSN